jgi:hypothetical protein
MDFEKQVLDSLRKGISEVIVSKLGGYNSPLDGVIKDVFEKEKQAVTDILRSVFQEVIGSDAFKATIKDEFQRKVAKNLVGMLEGQVTKAADALKQDPTMRSRIILAIEKIVTESNS